MKKRLLLFAVLLLFIGLLTVRDYGLSWDEKARVAYAYSSFDAYRSWFDRQFTPDYQDNFLRYYTGVYSDVFVVAFLKAIQTPVGSSAERIIWHFSYFVHFFLTALCLYGLARRHFNEQVAWSVMLLFLSQPLIWGHAFINHADTPMMGLFTAAVYTGFIVADRSLTKETPPLRQWGEKLRLGVMQTKRVLLGFLLAWMSFLLLALATDSFRGAAESLVRIFYYAEETSLKHRFFLSFAPFASVVPFEQYVNKLHIWVVRAEIALLALSVVGMTIYLLVRSKLFSWQGLADFLKSCLRSLFDGRVLLAGILLGLTISNRLIGLLAGGIVGLYWLSKSPRRALSILPAYGLWALLALYLTWPYLWPAPISRLIESIGLSAHFPWHGVVLFNGVHYPALELPFTYLPVLFHIQLTEPALIGLYFGLFLLVKHFRQRVSADLALYVVIGSLLPVVLLTLGWGLRYDNFRHVLFTLPAVFLLTGFAWEFLLHRLQRVWQRILLLLALVLPGVIPMFYLHPYEYVYYNALTGYTSGAFRRYEMDYWLTSFREVADYLNEHAEQGARILTRDGGHILMPYARPDLVLEEIHEVVPDAAAKYDYVVLTSRFDHDLLYPEAEIVAVVQRGKAIFAIVRRFSDPTTP